MEKSYLCSPFRKSNINIAMKVVSIEAQTREPNGKKGTKALRASGRIPAVVYGGDSVAHISVTAKSVKELVYTPDFKLAEIKADSESSKCILKDITFHPVTDEIVHIDFLRLIDGVPIKVDLPVKFRGDSPGVKLGGKLISQLRKVTVKTTPEKLVNELVVDVSNLELGDSVRVREIDVNDGVTLMVDGATPVGLVEIPRALRSASAAADKEGGEEAAEEVAE